MKYVCLSCFSVFEAETETSCICGSTSVISGEDLTKYAPASGSKSPKPKVEHIWFHINWGPFETVVSYTQALTQDQALEYATTTKHEWYVRVCSFDVNVPWEIKELNHEQFNQWCAKMWPVFRPTTTDESTS
jgi:hypothetical protein